ncbi:MAG: type IX secretion system sortase PorU, partial [Bacteroidetes bacterium]|nr:type IX secretion system sortase PorU [Bacteroidota bacterium]
TFFSGIGINPDDIDPRNIRIYGNGGAILPQENSAFRHDDLVENPIFIAGENDGNFNTGDYVYFYGQSAHTWTFGNETQRFKHNYHIYADTNFYYLNIATTPGKRLASIPSEANATNIAQKSRGVRFHETESENLIKSGRFWLGEKFDLVTERTRGFYIPDAKTDGKIRMTIRLAARSDVSTSFQIFAGSTNLGKIDLGSTNVSNSEARHYLAKTQTYIIDPSAVSSQDDSLYIKMIFNKSGSNRSEGWLDWIEIDYDQQLNTKGADQWFFSLSDDVLPGQITEFSIAGGSNNYQIWDITNPVEARMQEFSLTGTNMKFLVKSDSVKHFVAVKNSNLTPVSVEDVANQNLHGLSLVDYVMVTYPGFMEEAEKLADFHRNHYQRSVEIVTPKQIYNEFSSGKQDISAIRDFIRMIYKKSGGIAPGWVLLFGDGSYNYKNIKRQGSNITNFIPTYQSRDSWEPTDSYTSDDFFVMLDDDEGFWGESSGVDGDNSYEVNLLDVAIGRLPVETKEEAAGMVDKIIRYATNPDGEGLGAWRNRVVLVADHKEGEGSTHVGQANAYSSLIRNSNACINIDKIYMDNYQMVVSAGVTRFPEGREALLTALDQGSLIVNYTGHGGEYAWSNSRILEVPDIEGMDNADRLPVVITATCEFGRFDDPDRRSGAEIMTINPFTGAIALFTTVRLVYSSPNATLNQNFYREVFEFDSLKGRMPTLGEVMMRTKNNTFIRGNLANINSRNFTLLGDPGLILNYPQLKARITQINDEPVIDGEIDSLRSLGLVKVRGVIEDEFGNFQSNYNGEMDITVFDKPSLFTTRLSKFSFRWQKNRIFNGKARIENGEFFFEFVVPIDISYEDGDGKISLYFFNDETDGAGCYEDLYIGGTDENAAIDDQGPEVKLFINDANWISGGLTGKDPYLYAEVRDENGINTVGIGIGHEIIGILDGDDKNVFILGDYYTARYNSYQEGTVKYQMKDLENGEHELMIRVWDVANNSSEAYTRFIVSDDAVMALDQVLNFPNPFIESTEFLIAHNQAGKELDVNIEIFNLAGQVMKTLRASFLATGNVYKDLKWDGTSDRGTEISSGMYLYRVTLTNKETGQRIRQTERLVMIRE